ncbi:ankyrin repeat-containing domain protein [Phycomyces blakesleeanus]|uniref:Ankyrin repeat-containing domain protein n=1 Tax=Phycomyces blakesleeanus TaxID=4837 RepID=A0ABR3B3P6_PHYBL
MRRFRVAMENTKVVWPTRTNLASQLIRSHITSLGTYIPLQRATDLAKKYKVFDMLQPLLEFTKRDQSPPFTPKQTPLPTRPKKTTGVNRKQTRPRQITPCTQTEEIIVTEENKSLIAEELLENILYGNGELLRSETMNIVLDKEGHGSVHWAAALGKLVTIHKLVELGADLHMASYKGETALMRSVLFTDNFDGKTFEVLVDCLAPTLNAVDKRNRTVFHHAVLACRWKGRLQAGRYYLQHLLHRLKNDSRELFNSQDAYGDTPLMMAARLGCRQIVYLLLDAGASAQIPNHQSITAQMMIDVSSAVLQSATNQESGLDSLYEPIGTVVGPLSKSCVLDSRYTNILSERTKQTRAVRDRLDRATEQLNAQQALLVRLPEPGPWLVEAQHIHAVQTARLRKLTMILQREKLDRCLTSGVVVNQTLCYESLVTQLRMLKDKRKKLVAEKIALQSKVASCKLQDYKRLIGGCCGVEYDAVDGLLDGLVVVSSQPLGG